jgi:hypothetical protein
MKFNLKHLVFGLAVTVSSIANAQLSCYYFGNYIACNDGVYGCLCHPDNSQTQWVCKCWTLAAGPTRE